MSEWRLEIHREHGYRELHNRMCDLSADTATVREAADACIRILVGKLDEEHERAEKAEAERNEARALAGELYRSLNYLYEAIEWYRQDTYDREMPDKATMRPARKALDTYEALEAEDE